MPKPARLCCDVWKSIGGDKVASWTRFHGCLHASLCSLFSPYCPRLTGWCNSQQDHSFIPLLILLSAYSSSVLPPFPPSLSLSLLPASFPRVLTSFIPPSPLPPSLVRLLHHFSPFFSLSLPNLSLFLSLSHINQFLAVFFLIIHFLLSYFPSFTSPFFFPPRFISFFQPFPRFFSSLFTPSFFVFLPLILPRYLSASLHTFFFFLLWNVWWASS